jgi:hypothetical protein
VFLCLKEDPCLLAQNISAIMEKESRQSVSPSKYQATSAVTTSQIYTPSISFMKSFQMRCMFLHTLLSLWSRTDYPFSNKFLDIDVQAKRLIHSSLLEFGEVVVIDSAYTSRQRMRLLGLRTGEKRPPQVAQAHSLNLNMLSSSKEYFLLKVPLSTVNPKIGMVSVAYQSYTRVYRFKINRRSRVENWWGSYIKQTSSVATMIMLGRFD